MPIPCPDHVVVILKNHAYSQIIGNTDAPYINALMNSELRPGLFTQSYDHYHRVSRTTSTCTPAATKACSSTSRPVAIPSPPPTLGRNFDRFWVHLGELFEDLPSIGSDIETSLAHVRRHNPAANWVGTGTNQIPAATNLPFTAFPSNFDSLAHRLLVAPTQDYYQAHDMHDGSVTTGDTWVHDNLDAYAAWARTHNSLLILTFDEDDGLIISPNKIVTIFVGEDVVHGQYSNKHQRLPCPSSIEMYGSRPICNAAQVTTIRECWAGIAAADPISRRIRIRIHPNPSHDHPGSGRWDVYEARLYNPLAS
ncbi:MAG: alkaline phosphatase family protein [Bacteroidia bacterium]